MHEHAPIVARAAAEGKAPAGDALVTRKATTIVIAVGEAKQTANADRSWIGGLLVCLCLAAAASPQDASKPPPLTASDSESLGLWYRRHVTRTAEWHVRAYAADGMVMTNRTVREGIDGHVKGEVRIESTSAQNFEGFVWRSARLASDVDCAGSIAVNQYNQRRGRMERIVGNPDPRQTTLTFHEGQNLTGQTRSTPLEDGVFPPGPMGQALRDICALAIADQLDQGVASQGMLVVGRDTESLQAWAAALEVGDWEALALEASGANMRSKKVSKSGDKVRLSIRSEFLEPILSVSSMRAAEASRSGGGPGRSIQPYIRPIWVRSQLQEIEFNCKDRTTRTLSLSQYELRGLRRATSESRSSGAQPVNIGPNSYLTRHFAAVCDR